MKTKIIEAIVFSIVLPTFIGILAAVFDCRDLVVSTVVIGVYSLVSTLSKLPKSFIKKGG